MRCSIFELSLKISSVIFCVGWGIDSFQSFQAKEGDKIQERCKVFLSVKETKRAIKDSRGEKMTDERAFFKILVESKERR